MHDAIVAASRAVNSLADEPATAREHQPHQNAPACTIVGSVVTPSLLVVGWVGDSRAYWVPGGPQFAPGPAHRGRLVGRADGRRGPDERGGGVRRRARPRDHRLARRGRLRTGAAHRFLQAGPARCGGGVHATACGTTRRRPRRWPRSCRLDAAVRPLHSARVLVGHALDGGGHDNVTVAVVPFPAPPQGAGSA